MLSGGKMSSLSAERAKKQVHTVLMDTDINLMNIFDKFEDIDEKFIKKKRR